MTKTGRLFGTADPNAMLANGTAISMDPVGTYGDGIAGATKTFNIKYVRTSLPESVTAGAVKAAATFTFSYQ